MMRKACARQPWRIVEIQSCVLPYALAYCFMLLYIFLYSMHGSHDARLKGDLLRLMPKYYINNLGMITNENERASICTAAQIENSR